ncbi:MAG: DNA/RNA non-specific endonuclease [Deferribacterota bacterium]|nr:DNA/RNA non-specific endonuclease [Deferribacterota bacterium]
MGDVGRTDYFYTDASLPDDWYKIKYSDYTNGGLDRGHMCPSADRTKTVEDNKATFIMTNIVPQTAANNRGVWVNFENYLRDLVRNKNKEIYIIAGVYGSSGTIKDEEKVRIPLSTWKIAVILDNGDYDISRISDDTDVIAIVVPNKTSLDSDWKSYVHTVGYIEHLLTYDANNLNNYDFLSKVPDEIEKVIENKEFDGVVD